MSRRRLLKNRVRACCAVTLLIVTVLGDLRVLAETERIEVSTDLQIRSMAEGVWQHISWQVLPGGTRYPSNGLLVREGDTLMLIDTAWGQKPTRDLLAWIERTLKLPISRAIVTHAHDDRMGGMPVLAERGIPTFGHPLTGALATRQGWPQPAPLATLKEPAAATNVGPVEVFYPGPAHTADNLAVWLPRAKLLFGGCAVKELKSHTLGNVADADVAAWPEAIRRLQKRYTTEGIKLVPGHGEVGSSELLRHTLDLCDGQKLQKTQSSAVRPE